MMITLSSIPPLAPGWWRRAQQAKARAWGGAQREAAEMHRLAHQYDPGRRPSAAARIDAKAIYASRAATVRAARPAALPKYRDQACQGACHQATNGFEVCDETSVCKNLIRDRASRWPRPRTIADVVCSYYATTTKEATR